MDKKPTLTEYYLSQTRSDGVPTIEVPRKEKQQVADDINIDIDGAVDMLVEMMGGIKGQKTLREFRAVELKELAAIEEAKAEEEEKLQSFDFEDAVKWYAETLAEEAHALQQEFTTLSENNQEQSNEQ